MGISLVGYLPMKRLFHTHCWSHSVDTIGRPLATAHMNLAVRLILSVMRIVQSRGESTISPPKIQIKMCCQAGFPTGFYVFAQR